MMYSVLIAAFYIITLKHNLKKERITKMVTKVRCIILIPTDLNYFPHLKTIDSIFMKLISRYRSEKP